MKKIFNILGVVFLTCFSFYYTDKMIDLSKSQDVIMQKIIQSKNNYTLSAIDAFISNDYIIPGLNGISVNVDKSYYKMKELGFYNDNLYIYEVLIPKISIKNNFDKFIIRGNSKKNEVALIFKIEKTDNLNKIITIFNNNKVVANFFVNENIFINNSSYFKKIVDKNHLLGNLGINKSSIKSTNLLINKIKQYNNNYCYVETDNYEILNICKDLNMYTIKGTLVSNTNPYFFIKENLTSGGIYTLNTNNYTVKELNIILKYIKQRGYNIVTLDQLLSEENN